MAVAELVRSAAHAVAALFSSPKHEAYDANEEFDSPPIRARYDAAQTTDEYKNYWAATDALSADAGNSKSVRQKLVQRSRYEIDNNAYVDSMAQTHANYVNGIAGPSLRMQTASKPFNQMVEREFKKWCKAIKLRRKLWAMSHAKVSDGETFGMLRSNPNVKHPVKLDLVVLETEQCTTPFLPYGEAGYIDGVKFDEYGDPQWYDILPFHPGSEWYHSQWQADAVPARFILHWFAMRRGGQHRGVPEFKSSLNVGASSRRWREATLAASETAAQIAVLLTTNMPPNEEADQVAPFSSVEFRKRMMTTAPMGWQAGQMKAEHPNATYEAFHRAQVSEQGRSKNMPHNLAAGDSSNHNFASGKLDFTPYYMQTGVEREDANDMLLDPLFELWFEEAALRFGWVQIPGQTPDHTWDWPANPVADEQAKASANETRLKTAQVTISQLYSEDGEDFEDVLPVMASDYGVSEDEMRVIIRTSIFNDKGALASMEQAKNAAESLANQPSKDTQGAVTSA